MAASQIKLLNLGVGLDLLRRTFLEDAAVVHHRYALDDAKRDVHVVLDDDVADMAGQPGQDLHQFASLGRRQTGGRFVEQDETRRAGKRERDFKLALLTVGELGYPATLHRGQMHRLDQIVGRLHQRVVAARPKWREAAARNATAGEVDVVVNVQARKQRGNLIGAPKAAADALIRRKVGHVLAEEADRAGGRGKIAGDAVEQRGLPSPVGAEHRAPLAGTYRQRHVD